MRIGSVQFIGVLVLVAFGSVAAGLVLDIRPLLWCAIVVGAYAIHLTAMYEAGSRTEDVSPRAAVRAETSALEREREEVERLRRELVKKLAQTEEQWTLLRSMVQERLRRSGASDPGAPGAELAADVDRRNSTDRNTKPAPASDEAGRAYSRW
jgi:hypothetical protein